MGWKGHAALDGRPLEAEELEYGVAHGGNRRGRDRGEYEQQDKREGKGPAQAGNERLGSPPARLRVGQPGAHTRGQVRGVGPVKLAAELSEHAVELSHQQTSMRSRRRPSARASRDLTVPRAQPRAAAVSCSDSSRK